MNEKEFKTKLIEIMGHIVQTGNDSVEMEIPHKGKVAIISVKLSMKDD